MRSAIVLSFALLSSGTLTLFADEVGSTVSVIWADGVESPGVCVEKATWFASVLPSSVSVDAVKTPSLRGATATVEGRILYLDPEQRLCLIEASDGLGELRPVPLSTGVPPKAGARAECISGDSACLTTVVGKDWSYRGEKFALPLLRLRVSEAGPHCKAGTPLVGEGGDLIAILTGEMLEGNGEVYAIPATRVRKLVEDMKRHQRSGPVWIGLTFHNESSTPEVIEVKAGSPAQKSGAKPGDIILAMDNSEIETLDDLVEAIHNLPAGEPVKVRVLRGLEEAQLEMVPLFSAITSVSR